MIRLCCDIRTAPAADPEVVDKYRLDLLSLRVAIPLLEKLKRNRDEHSNVHHWFRSGALTPDRWLRYARTGNADIFRGLVALTICLVSHDRRRP